MLSQENIDKLCMTGIYRANPADFYPDNTSLRNWIFRVERDGNDFLMVDTYWKSCPNTFVLNDRNFDMFKFLFDLNEVEKYTDEYFYEYAPDDRWCAAAEPGSRSSERYVRKGAKPVLNLVIMKLKYEIESLKVKLEEKKKLLDEIVSGGGEEAYKIF